jgi:hypothetical protein
MTQEAKWASVVKRFQHRPHLLTAEVKEKFMNKTLTPTDLPEPFWSYRSSRSLRACMDADTDEALGWE